MNHRASITVRRTAPIAALLAVALISGCSDLGSSSTSATIGTGKPSGTDGGPLAGPARSAHLQEFTDCDEFLSWNKEQMLQRVTPYGLDFGYFYDGRDGRVQMGDEAQAANPTAAEGSAPATTLPTADQAGGASSTNTQDAGVDETDVTETDGTYVYSLIDGRLRSVDIAGQKVISDIAEPLPDAQMILFGQRLLVVGQDWTSSDQDSLVAQYSVVGGVITLISRSHLEGSLISTRSVDGVARIVLKLPFASRLPFVQPRDYDVQGEDLALEQNRAVIEAATVEDLLPRGYEEGANGGTGELRTMLDCAQLGHPAEFSGFNTVWVATVDLTAGDLTAGDAGTDASANVPAGAAGVIADAQTVYASADHLFVGTIAYPDVTSDTVPVRPEPTRTAIHSFDLNVPDGADYAASGEVDGTVLNSYALSEFDGRLRVATTTDQGGFGSTRESGIHVFEQQGDDLIEVGSVGGLGRSEDIQAVRYLDATAYVVTFRQTDPLYVLDLSDPTRPTLSGELKVPGFSTYLHPAGDGLLLAIGYAGNDNGLSGGTQLSLFDVVDPANPTLIQTVPVGDYSEATFDPHAFLFWAETGTLVVPNGSYCDVHITEDQAPDEQVGGQQPPDQDCASAIVARLRDRTLTEQGRLDQADPIRRSLVVGGQLVTVSSNGVRVHDLATLAPIADIDFSGIVQG